MVAPIPTKSKGFTIISADRDWAFCLEMSSVRDQALASQPMPPKDLDSRQRFPRISHPNLRFAFDGLNVSIHPLTSQRRGPAHPQAADYLRPAWLFGEGIWTDAGGDAVISMNLLLLRAILDGFVVAPPLVGRLNEIPIVW